MQIRSTSSYMIVWLSIPLVLIGVASACVHRDLLTNVPAVNEDLSIHVVVENPAGSSEKWEVQASGRMSQERAEGRAVTIPYIPWPVNSGMVPRTLHSRALGGDNEPLDVLLLGPKRDRGELVRAIPIGLLRVIDQLERDDKILAVVPGETFGEIRSVEELDTKHPGIREILSLWYSHSRPGGSIEVQGVGSRAAAQLLIADCAAAFDEALRDDALPVWSR